MKLLPNKHFLQLLVEWLHSSHVTTFIASLKLGTTILGPVAGTIIGFIMFIYLEKKVEDVFKVAGEKVRMKGEEWSETHKFLAGIMRLLKWILPDFENLEKDKKDRSKVIEHFFNKKLNDPKIQKELENKIIKFMSGEYENNIEFEKNLKDFFGTKTTTEALDLYFDFKDFIFSKKTLEVLSVISGMKDRQEQIFEEFNKLENKLDSKLNKFKTEILNGFGKILSDLNLSELGFELITPYNIYNRTPNKKCWEEGFELEDIANGYDARRVITDATLDYLYNGEDVLILGESGFGKTTLLYRIIIEAIGNYDKILLKKGTEETIPLKLELLINNLTNNGKILIAVDNVHREDNWSVFEVTGRLKLNPDINFVLTAREPEFMDALKEKMVIKSEILLQTVEKEKERMKKIKQEDLYLKEEEGRIFVEKYLKVEGFDITEEERTKMPERLKEYNYDPLLFTLYITGETKGLRGNIISRYKDIKNNEVCEDITLFSCLIDVVDIKITKKLILDSLKLEDKNYGDAMNVLVGRILYKKNGAVFRTRHPRWAMEYLIYRYEYEGEHTKEFLKKKIESYVENFFSLEIKDEAFRFTALLSVLLIYEIKLRELLLDCVKVPEFLDIEKKATLYSRFLGYLYYMIGNYEKCIEAGTKAIEFKDDYTGAYINRGLSYLKKEDFEMAIEDFTKAIELHENFADAYFNRGNTYFKKEDFDSAIEDFSKAIELNKDDTKAYNNRGLAYLKKGDFEKAIEDITKAIELNKDDAKAYYNRGNAYFEKENFERAIEDFSKAIEFKENYSEAYNYRGLAYSEKGDFDRAIEEFTKAIKLKRNYSKAYNNRGLAYLNKGDFERGIENLIKAIEFEENYAEAYCNIGNAYFDKGDIIKAIENYTKAIEFKEDFAEAYNSKGDAYFYKGDFDRAIVDYTKAIELNKDYDGAYYNRGNVYFEKEDFDRAIEDFNKVIELKENYSEAYNYRGVAYSKKGDFEKAIEDFTKAIELNKDDAGAYNNRGVAFAEKEDYNKSIKDYTKAIKLKKDFAEAYSNRGDDYYKKGEYYNAAEDIGNAGFLFIIQGITENQRFFKNAFENLKECYDLRIKTSNPVCHESGVAIVALLSIEGKETESKEIIKEVKKNENKLSDSARILLDVLLGKKEKVIKVENFKDRAFEFLLKYLKKKSGNRY